MKDNFKGATDKKREVRRIIVWWRQSGQRLVRKISFGNIMWMSLQDSCLEMSTSNQATELLV